MSMIYCERHDIRWDSDKKERCPQCEVDNMDIVYELLAALEGLMPESTSYASSAFVDKYLNAVVVARDAIAKAKGDL